MKNLNYLRDPDSLVVESTTGIGHRTFGGTKWIVFAAYFRAHNGFGGYNQDMVWVLCTEDGKREILSDDQYAELNAREFAVASATPSPSAAHHKKNVK